MGKRQRHGFMVSTAAVIVALTAACDGEPASAPELETAELRLQLVNTGIPEKPLLEVWMEPASDGDTLPADPIEVSLTAPSDAESVTLGPNVCTDETGAEYVCSELVVGMETGEDVRSLEPYVEEIDGRLKLLVACDETGSCEVVSTAHAVVVLFDGDLDAAMETARGWPGVEAVDRNGLVSATDALRKQRTKVLPLAYAEAVPGNGVVEGLAGDTVRVRYRSPDGAEAKSELRL